MKSNLLIFLMGSFLFCSNIGYAAKGVNDQTGGQEKSSNIKIVGSPELENLINAWITGYRGKQTGEEINVSYDAGKMADGNIYFFSSNKLPEGVEKLADKMIVGREIIVPVMNAKSPVAEKLNSEGMTVSDFSRLLSGNATWDKVKLNWDNVPVRVFISDNKVLAPKLAGFSKMAESAVSAREVSSAEELLSVVRNDIYAIGFCRLSDVLGSGESGFAAGVSIVPIDKNQNGQIDGFENIYSSPETLTRGAWIGKYPRQLCSEVFAASTSLPMNNASNNFLEWVIDEGQEPLVAQGFSNISTREKTAGLLALRPPSPAGYTPPASGRPGIWVMVAAVMAFLVLVYMVIRTSFMRKSGIRSEDIEITSALNVNSIQAPAGLYYDKTHTWTFMEQNGLVKVGIDDFLPHVTGKLSQIMMKAPGEKIRKGEKILTIVREGKQLNIYSPVTGIIKSQNDSLTTNPSQINTDPYVAGWVYQVEPANWLRETKFMFMSDKFIDWLDDEFVRLKDFLAASANTNTVVYNHIVLQDGGELTDNVLAGMEPEVWEDFQTQFIDVSR